MKEIYQDILRVDHGLIAHQVNCRGKMAAGLAGKISKKWPVVKRDYLKVCDQSSGDAHLLGFSLISKISHGLYVASIFGQLNYGRANGVCYTNYAALIEGLKSAHGDAGKLMAKPLPMYVPYGIGCGLGGGDWMVISSLLEQELPDVILCKLRGFD